MSPARPPRRVGPPRRGAPDRRPTTEPRTHRGGPTHPLGGDRVEGRRAVHELLAAGRRPVRRLLFSEGLEPSAQLDEIEALARSRKVRVEVVGRRRLEAEALTEAPQGVLAMAAPIEPVDLEELCAPAQGDAFLVVVAGVSDPRNLGALLRSAECAGATGVVLARHRAAHLSPAAVKVAAGAVEHLSFAVVGGIPAALSTLSDLGVFSLGLAGEAHRSLFDASFGEGPVALVVGGEEKGLAPLVRKRCDLVVAIPQGGALPSLNVAAATAVACFEVARQRARVAPAG
jgi:23S rRNA (guanosine2251-2'-O)-methyltransferase